MHKLELNDIMEIGSNEFKVTYLEPGKLCELTIIIGMTGYL